MPTNRKKEDAMGCYDTVKIPCPICGAQYKAQTKAGRCSLVEYGIIDAPAILLADLTGEKMQCGNCGVYFELKVQIMARPVIREEESEDV